MRKTIHSMLLQSYGDYDGRLIKWMKKEYGQADIVKRYISITQAIRAIEELVDNARRKKKGGDVDIGEIRNIASNAFSAKEKMRLGLYGIDKKDKGAILDLMEWGRGVFFVTIIKKFEKVINKYCATGYTSNRSDYINSFYTHFLFELDSRIVKYKGIGRSDRRITEDMLDKDKRLNVYRLVSNCLYIAHNKAIREQDESIRSADIAGGTVEYKTEYVIDKIADDIEDRRDGMMLFDCCGGDDLTFDDVITLELFRDFVGDIKFESYKDILDTGEGLDSEEGQELLSDIALFREQEGVIV